MAHIIAIANQKGGICKTTTAVNLTIALKKAGKKTLLIDTDEQANATDTFRGNYEEATTLFDVLFEKVPIKEAIQKTQYGDLIAGDPLLNEADQRLTKLGRERELKKAIAPIVDEYDFIILDTPPGLGIMLINSLTAAQSVLIPVEPDRYSFMGLQRFFDTLEDIKDISNPSITPLGILLVKVDSRTNLSKEFLDSLPELALEKWKANVFDTKIRFSVAVKYSQIDQTGLSDYDPENTVSIDYEKLAKEVINEVANG